MFFSLFKDKSPQGRTQRLSVLVRNLREASPKGDQISQSVTTIIDAKEFQRSPELFPKNFNSVVPAPMDGLAVQVQTRNPSASSSADLVHAVTTKSPLEMRGDIKPWSALISQTCCLPKLAPARLSGCRGFIGSVPQPLWMSIFYSIVAGVYHAEKGLSN
jgi:hypothetical protein